MNIIILTDRYHPNPVSSAILAYDLAIELNQQGHNVFVLTADSKLDCEYTISKEEGINIIRVRAQNQKKLSKPRRLIFELFLQKKIWNIYKNNKETISFDLLIAQSPTIFWSFLIKKLKGEYQQISVYLILRDIFPKWAVDTGIISKFNPIYWFLRWHEKKLYNQVNIIGVQSASNLEYFSKKKEKFDLEILYNFKKIGQKETSVSNIRKDLNIENKVIFVFGGNLGYAQDIDNILRLVKSFKEDERIHFLLIGEGTEYKKIESFINLHSTKTLTLLPAVSDSDYQAILKECDVGIISLRRSFKTDNFPNKILNYMEYNLPILASINPGNELRLLIEKNHNGLVSDNGQDDLFIENANILLNNQSKRNEMGLNGYYTLKKYFDVSSAVKQLTKIEY
jgi:glycosyltransferase involved in cell wall biosynthesis